MASTVGATYGEHNSNPGVQDCYIRLVRMDITGMDATKTVIHALAPTFVIYCAAASRIEVRGVWGTDAVFPVNRGKDERLDVTPKPQTDMFSASADVHMPTR